MFLYNINQPFCMFTVNVSWLKFRIAVKENWKFNYINLKFTIMDIYILYQFWLKVVYQCTGDRSVHHIYMQGKTYTWGFNQRYIQFSVTIKVCLIYS